LKESQSRKRKWEFTRAEKARIKMWGGPARGFRKRVGRGVDDIMPSEKNQGGGGKRGGDIR